MNSFDWLSDLALPSSGDPFDIVEIRFKNTTKRFYRNINTLDLTSGDAVIVESDGGGYDLGHVALTGVLASHQLKKKNVPDNSTEIRKLYRRASENEIRRWNELREKETSFLSRARGVIRELKLQMKLSDVEYQGDGKKAVFFYTADDRVDFRELIKKLAAEFKIRTEMRQITLRQEAGRLGGIGSCGRELCCSTWLTDFKQVSTSAAQYQNLSLNPLKLSGQCGRLKCCLNYELETYLEALKFIPVISKPVETERGPATLQRTDIFKRVMWFSYENESDWCAVPVPRVEALLEMNAKGIKPTALLEESNGNTEKKSDYADVVGQSRLAERSKGKKHKSRDRKR